MVTKEEYVDWRSNKVTKEYLKALWTKREALKEGLVDGNCETQKDEQITIGKTQALKDAINYALEEFEYLEIDQGETVKS